MDIKALLPQLLPRAIAWAENVSAEVTRSGEKLLEKEMVLAKSVGVQFPENIRVMIVPEMPIPSDPQLKMAGLQTGLLGPHTIGLTLGYSILIRHGHHSTRLLSHECRHVFQYEKVGGISLFLPQYLETIVEHGYNNSPFEIDARVNEGA